MSEFSVLNTVKSKLHGTCKSCHNAKRRADYVKSDRRKLENKKYNKTNPHIVKISAVKYYRNHTEKCREIRNKWNRENPDKVTAMKARRRALEIQAYPKWANLHEIKKFYKKAKELTLSSGVPHEVDHIVPLKGKIVCGLHVEYNLRVITKVENRKKHASLIEDVL